jgi:hypothetical protein
MNPVNRLKPFQPLAGADIDSGTPDEDVSRFRLAGREAYRAGLRYNRSWELPVTEGNRIDFWDGYLDERTFERIGGQSGRGVKP